jgi:hypothetical protein
MMISEELWQQCQKVRENRHQKVKSRKATRHIYLLNGIIVCAECGRRLRAQTPKGRGSYYREVPHLNGFDDCSNLRTSVRSAINSCTISQTTYRLGTIRSKIVTRRPDKPRLGSGTKGNPRKKFAE